MSTKVFKGNNKLLMRSGERLYLHSKTADMSFVFEIDGDLTEHVPAHKIMLSAGSPVFEAMFFGSIKETGDVQIVDASPAAFREFLQFFYLGSVQLTPENIFTVTNLCHKYEVADGLLLCETGMLKTLSVTDNMCSGYELALLLELQKVIKFCEQKITESLEGVLNSIDFLNCNEVMLKRIVQLVQLSKGSASLIVNGCMAWANNKCQQKNVETTTENLKKEFGSLLVEIPSLVAELSKEEFAQFAVSNKGLLSDIDLERIILSLMMRNEKIIKDCEGKMLN
ncbi:BTB/POZ domain-containing protein 6-A-like, partial [Contarinia nasturtii]|uniref:BTB/POZ domain-containing protein 6-A-like n=1 Tax=Contarinia nasturtii TaxID=265458 RepID=UPI0012D41765